MKAFQQNIMLILKRFPELLPLKVQEIIEQGQENKSIWNPLEIQDFQSVLFINSMKTIQNKQILREFQNSLWFKRNIYSIHGVLPCTKQQIQICHKQLCENTFYNFYSYYLQLRKKLQQQIIQIQKKQSNNPFLQKQPQLEMSFLMRQSTINDSFNLNTTIKQLRTKINKIKQLFQYVEQNYELIPQQIKGYTQIYYKFSADKAQISQKLKNVKLRQLLKLKSEQLFKIYFQIQKLDKGFIFKYLRVIYEQNVENGKARFIEDIRKFFNSEMADISDLKIILNRFNSQHLQFFYQYEKLYEVIVQTVKNKMVIGSDKDISVNQIVIYLEDIAFSKDNHKLIKNLRFISKVHKQQKILRRVKLNMSIEQIHLEPIKTMSKMILFQIQRNQIYAIPDYIEYKMCAYKIISEINKVRVSLYGQEFNKFVMFAYLVQTMKNKKLLPFAVQLLMNQKYLTEFFQIDQQFKLSLFYYLFKWKTSTNNLNFLQHEAYITDIMTFMPEITPQVKFVHLQLSYAQIFHQCGQSISYPICLGKIPTLNQIQAHIHRINILDLQKIHIKNLFNIMEDMREMYEPDVEQNLEDKKIWFLKQLHQMFLCKFIQQKKLKQAIKIIYEMLKFPKSEGCIIYPILIIDQMMSQLIDSSQILILNLVSYYFNQPQQLTKIIEELLTTKKSTLQFQETIKIKIRQQQLKKIKKYTFKNAKILFKKQFAMLIKNNGTFQSNNYKDKFEQILQCCLNHVCLSKEELKKHKSYNLIYRILCHSPYLLAKYLFCRTKSFNLKNVRAFFSYLTQQLAFQSLNVLKFAKRIFQIVLYRMINNISLDQLISKYSQIQFSDQEQFDQCFQNLQLNTEIMLFNSIELMKSKIKYFEQNSLNQKIKNSYKKINIKQQKRKIEQRIHKMKSSFNSSDARKNSIQANSMQSLGRKSLQFKFTDEELLIRESAKVYDYTLKDVEDFKAILETPEVILELLPSKYIFKDGDDSYGKQQTQQFRWEVKVKWPTQLVFNEIKQRIQIFCNKSNTRFQKVASTRKKSQFYQQSVRFKGDSHKSKSEAFLPLISMMLSGQNCFGQTIIKKNESIISQQQQSPKSPTIKRGARAKLQKLKQTNLKNISVFSLFNNSSDNDKSQEFQSSHNLKVQNDLNQYELNQKIIQLKRQLCEIFVGQNENAIEQVLDKQKYKENQENFQKLITKLLQSIYNDKSIALRKRFNIVEQTSKKYLMMYRREHKFSIIKKVMFFQLTNKWFFQQFPQIFEFNQLFKHSIKSQSSNSNGFEQQKGIFFSSVLKNLSNILRPLNIDFIESIILHSFGNKQRQKVVFCLIQKLIQKQLRQKTVKQLLESQNRQLQIVKELMKKIQKAKVEAQVQNKDINEVLAHLAAQLSKEQN